MPNVVFDTSIKIFADDTKAYKEIRNNDDVNKLQKAIDEMYEWTQKWLLKFNEQKCKMLHLCSNNVKNNYFQGLYRIFTSHKKCEEFDFFPENVRNLTFFPKM